MSREVLGDAPADAPVPDSSRRQPGRRALDPQVADPQPADQDFTRPVPPLRALEPAAVTGPPIDAGALAVTTTPTGTDVAAGIGPLTSDEPLTGTGPSTPAPLVPGPSTAAPATGPAAPGSPDPARFVATAPFAATPIAATTRSTAPERSTSEPSTPAPSTTPEPPTPEPSTAEPPTTSSATGPAGSPFPRTLLVLAVMVGLVAGWAGDAAWRSGQSTDQRLRTAGVSVVVTDAQRTDETALRTSAELTVRVANLGLVPVQVTGSELTYDAGAIVGIDPPHVTVPVAGSGTAVLRVAVGCRSPQPLRLPPLQAQTPDGALLSVPVDGSGQALADLCDSGPEVDHVLRLVGVSRTGTELKLLVSSASGRTTQILQLQAGGVDLPARPLPVVVDGTVRTVWLQPPASCPVEWQRTGFPEDLRLDLDTGADVTVPVPVGFALAAWLVDGACAGRAR